MAELDAYRRAIEDVLREYSSDRYAIPGIEQEVVFDRQHDRYLLVNHGWDREGRRFHHTYLHLDIIDGKVWIQCDETEEGVGLDLIRAGVPKDRIVFGYRRPEIRDLITFDAV
jgi:hypothetical protein